MREQSSQEQEDADSEEVVGTVDRRRILGAGLLGALGVGGAYYLRRSSRASDPTAPVSITVWSWQSSDEVDALKEIAASFNALQTDVKVDVLQRPDVISTGQLLHTTRNGLGPDLCVGGRNLIAERDVVGLFEDIAPYLGEESRGLSLDRDFYPFAVREVTIGARVLGVPLDSTVRVLMFNRSALGEQGLSLEEWNPENGPVTFDRLAEVARLLDRRDASGVYERAGFVPTFGHASVQQYLHSWQAEYFSEQQCAFTVDSAEARSATQWVHDFRQEAGQQEIDDFLRKDQGIVYESPFLRGDIVFALTTDEELRRILAAPSAFDMGATFVPVASATAPSRSWATGNAISLMSGSRHPQEAMQFLEYLTSAEVLDRYCQNLGRLSSRMDASMDDALPAFIADSVLLTAVSSPHVPIASWFDELLEQYWWDAITGQVEIEAGLGQLQNEANEALADAAVCVPV